MIRDAVIEFASEPILDTYLQKIAIEPTGGGSDGVQIMLSRSKTRSMNSSRRAVELSVKVRCPLIAWGAPSQPAVCRRGTTNFRQVSASVFT